MVGTVEVTNDDESLEASPLTGTGLLLDGHDLEHLVLEASDELIDDLVLLDGERVEVDLLELGHLAGLDETAELGSGHPVLLLLALLATGTTTAAATTALTATSTTSFTATTAPAAEATLTRTPPTSLFGRSGVSHLLMGSSIDSNGAAASTDL
jgi:hypothetical protein